MSTSIPEFWKLVIDSQLLAPEQCQTLGVEYGHVKGAAGDGNAKTLAEWLISRNILSRYQAKILVAGHPGPFVYGDYQVYDRLESGRYAGGFRAVHTLSRHPVLLHFLTGDVTRDANIWAATANHAQAIVRMDHPQLQRYYEVVDLASFKFLVSEDLDGQTLADLLEGGHLESNDACRIARMAAQGLDSLHRAGLVHADVRPHNIWVEPTGNVKLLIDPLRHGTATDLSNLATDAQAALKTDYLAPEFTQPSKTPDVLTDIYALGCSLYETLAGKPPFAGGDVNQKLQRHATEPIQSLQSVGVSDSVDQLVSYLMAKNPGVRYQDVSTVVEQIAPFVDPAQLHPPVAAPAGTLPAFEAALQTKQASTPPQPAAPSAPQVRRVTPKPDVNVAASPKVNVAPAPTTPNVGVVDVASATKAPASPVTAASKAQAEQKKTMQLAVGLGIAAIVLIGGLVALQMSMTGPDETGTTIADGGDGQTNVTQTGNSTDNGDSASTTNNEAGATGTNGPDGTSGTDATSTTPPPATAEVVGLPQNVVSDDGKLPWASPTNGKPIELDYVPPNAQVHMFVRPAAIAASPDGERVLKSLGPEFSSARKMWERAAGFSLEEIDSITIAMHDNDGRFPRPSFVVRLNDKLKTDELVSKWGNPSQLSAEGGSYYKGNTWSFFIPGTEPGVFVMGSEKDIKEVAATGGAPQPIRRQSDKLRKVSDRDRHFTVIFSPNYLFSDGRELLSGKRERIKEPLSWFLGDSLMSGMASMHFDGNFFVEMRMFSNIDTDPHTLASEVRDRLEEVPDRVEEYLVRINPHPYWKRVAFRFPGMINSLHAETRVGVEGEQAVINSVLPSYASYNLVFASSMVMEATPGAVVAAAPSKPKGPQTMDELLNTKTSLAFAQQSLEFSMRDLGQAVADDFPDLPFPFAIKIIGADLEKDGITRNQQVRDVNERDKTVGEILTSIVVTAAATGKPANAPEQKLIWVVGPDPEDKTKQIILVTTRAAATTNNYTLPDAFK